MKKLIYGLVVIIALVMMGGCTKVEPGWVGIKVNQTGSDKGVSNDNLRTGLTFYLPYFQKVIDYPAYAQRVIWTKSATEGSKDDDSISFQTKDSVAVHTDIALLYKLKTDKIPQFYAMFRNDDIRLFTNGTLRDTVRDAMNICAVHFTFDELNGPKKTEFFKQVQDVIAQKMIPYGVEIMSISSVSKIEPPENLKNAINAKVEANQKADQAENKLRQIKAEASQRIEEAKGVAESNRIKASTITTQNVEWEKLQIERLKSEKWDGKLPGTYAGSTLPMLNLK